MTEPAVPPNQQQVGIRTRQPANGIDSIDSCLEAGAIGRNEHCIFSALEEDFGQQNGLNYQDVAHVVPGLAEVDPAAENGDEVAANERLQQMEQEDLKAARIILGQLPIPKNAITVRHYWMVLKKVRVKLSKGGSYNMPHKKEYARILERLARVMTIPSKQDYESTPGAHHLGYDFVFNVLEEMTPDFLRVHPLGDDECLDRLQQDMTATFSMMRVEDGVNVIKDRESYAKCLRSLAVRLVSRDV